jgi:hypothetical protein
MKKHILKENYDRLFGKREFGDPLHTFKGVMEKHQQINEDKDKVLMGNLKDHMGHIFDINPMNISGRIEGMLSLDGLGMKRWKKIRDAHKAYQKAFDKFVKVVNNEYEARSKEA